VFVLLVGWTSWSVHQIDLLRQRAEERVLLAVECAEIGMWDYDLVNGEVTWSPRCKAIFGLAPDAPVDHAKFFQCLHPDDRERVQEAVRQTADPQGGGEQNLDYRALWPDGTVRWIIAKGRATFAGEGAERRAVRLTGAAIDVTERKLSEERAQQHLADLTHLGRIQLAGEMASGLAHELNQPLAAISIQAGLAAALARESQGAYAVEVQARLDEIAQQAARAGGIIRMLRDFVHKGETRRVAVQLDDIVREVMLFFEAPLRRQQIQ
jgi:PAS domain S-box-containing protein